MKRPSGYDIHPAQVSEWNKTIAKNAASAFGTGAGKTDSEKFERERARLHAKIGQQAVELDWLTKKCKCPIIVALRAPRVTGYIRGHVQQPW